MDLRKIKKLIELLDESGISEIEIREGEESVRISRYGQGSAQAFQAVVPVQATADATPAVEGHKGNGTEPLEVPTNGQTVTSPMVGTFYEAPSPGDEPFVEVGQRVKAGDTLCIIEAMKILNEIETERSGVITAILAENGQPVEYGQPLFVLD